MSNLQFQSITDFVEICDGLRKPINSKTRNKRIAGKSESKLYPYYGATGKVGVIDDYLIDGEYVLVGEDGAPFLDAFKNKAYIIKGKAWVNNHAHILKAIEGRSISEFICHYLNYFNYDEFVNGTTRLKLTKSKLIQIPVPNFTYKNQIKITEKVNNLFKSIDSGLGELKIAQSKIDIFKKSIIDSAIRGNLIPQDENDEPASLFLEKINIEKNSLKESGKLKKEKELLPIGLDEMPFELPKGWGWVRLGSLIYSIQAGKSFKCDERPPQDDEIGVVKVNAVTWGEYDEKKSKTCINKKMVNPDFYIQEGDFLFSRANTIELIGAVVIARKINLKVMLSDKILRFRFIDQSIKEWILLCLRSQYGRSFIQKNSTGNQDSMRNIGQNAIKNILIPIPPKKERENITHKFELLIYQQVHVSNNLIELFEISKTLKQSILKNAFEGKLI